MPLSEEVRYSTTARYLPLLPCFISERRFCRLRRCRSVARARPRRTVARQNNRTFCISGRGLRTWSKSSPAFLARPNWIQAAVFSRRAQSRSCRPRERRLFFRYLGSEPVMRCWTCRVCDVGGQGLGPLLQPRRRVPQWHRRRHRCRQSRCVVDRGWRYSALFWPESRYRFRRSVHRAATLACHC